MYSLFCGNKLREAAKFATKVQCGDNYASQKNVCEWKVRLKKWNDGALLMGVPGDHRLQYDYVLELRVQIDLRQPKRQYS
jgi:hypothetical protein